MENDQQRPIPQPIQQPAAVPPQAPIPVQKKSKMLIIIITVVFILILIAGAAFVLLRKKEVTTPVDTITPTPVVSVPSVTLVPTVDSGIEMTLEKGKAVVIPTTIIQIQYIGANVPNPNCMDCSATTNITLQQAGVVKTLNFLCGGLVGKCTDKLTEFGYEVNLQNASETTAKVKIKKQ